MIASFNFRKQFIAGIVLLLLLISCSSNKDSLTSTQILDVKLNVLRLADSIAAGVSHDGPIAWIRYFENSPEFFMASGGQLVFPDNDSANRFIRNSLVKIMPDIKLKWNDIRIDPLTLNLAGISAEFHEDFRDAAGNLSSEDGYFTAVAHKTEKGWKLRNAHWSEKSGSVTKN